MKRSLCTIAFLLFAATAQAQTVDVVQGFGRVFDIPSATWMTFYVPGIEASYERFTLNVSHLFDTKLASSETNVTLSYRIDFERLSLSVATAKWFYHMKFTDVSKQRKSDWRYFIEGRIRIKQ